jgi:hypothetical protein
MAKKTATENPFLGLWHITSMSEWDEEYLHEEVRAFFEFEQKGVGTFQFGYVRGQIDFRITTRDGNPAVEFSFEAVDGADGTPETGRGWAVLRGDELKGMFFFHMGDESDFVARRSKTKKKKR